MNTKSTKTKFIAYVYPGWHSSDWRPGISEWDLLDHFMPYFEGHEPIPRPLAGPYDDSEPDTVKRQVKMAQEAGIAGFNFFLYYGEDGFIMDKPLELALNEAEGKNFFVGTTWCLRLPHNNFPIPEELDGIGMVPTRVLKAEKETKPITVGDIVAQLQQEELKNIKLNFFRAFFVEPEVEDFQMDIKSGDD